MNHDELQADLAQSFLGNGEAIVQRLSLGSYGEDGQMDVFRMRLSRANPNPTCYEVKVSRADFMADTQKGKYRRYLPYVRRLYFAAPSGLLAKADIPADAGLIVRGERGWAVVKAAPVQATITDDAWVGLLMSIVLKLHPGPWDKPNREERIARGLRDADGSLRHLGRNLSAAVAKQIEAAREVLNNDRWARQRLGRRLGLSEAEAVERDLADLVDAVLQRAPASREAENMVERAPVEAAVRELGWEIDRLTRMRDNLTAALPEPKGSVA